MDNLNVNLNGMNLMYDFGNDGSIYDYLFHKECFDRNIKSISRFEYSSDCIYKEIKEFDFIFQYSYVTPKIGKEDPEEALKKLFKARSSDDLETNSFGFVALYKNTPIQIRCNSGDYFYGNIGSTSKKLVGEIMKIITDNFPERKLSVNTAYDVNFWFCGPNGPKNTPREFNEQSLSDILINYNEEDKVRIADLKNYKPKKGGELLLLTGEAGVGKTNLLLSIFKEWKDWATFNYILDPPTFFGGNPAYLLDLILGDKNDTPHSRKDEPDNRKWKIFVMEDCGEMLGVDAKEKTGSALSLFLNVTEGFVGRGTKTIIILTTNEEMNKLHPAVARPGRCVFRHKFGKLSEEESFEWLTKKGKKNLTGRIDGPKTLAELYAIINESENNKQKEKVNKVGFLKDK